MPRQRRIEIAISVAGDVRETRVLTVADADGAARARRWARHRFNEYVADFGGTFGLGHLPIDAVWRMDGGSAGVRQGRLAGAAGAVTAVEGVFERKGASALRTAFA